MARNDQFELIERWNTDGATVRELCRHYKVDRRTLLARATRVRTKGLFLRQLPDEAKPTSAARPMFLQTHVDVDTFHRISALFTNVDSGAVRELVQLGLEQKEAAHIAGQAPADPPAVVAPVLASDEPAPKPPLNLFE